MSDYIPKPVRPEILSEVLKKWLRKKEDAPQIDFHVLIVDDNPINRKVVEEICKRLKWLPHTANDGSQAVTMLEEKEYDLVLMDCQMPVMDGYEATREIRKKNSKIKNHAVPIIAVTANTNPENKAKCIEAGMDDFISKPIKLEILEQLIQKLLKKSFI